MTTTNVVAPALADDFAGRLVGPGDASYDEARAIWNGQIDRRPAVIATCSGLSDVLAAVRHCRRNDVDFSVRGGGHAVAGHALNDGGLVIDLSAMTAVHVDPVSRTARVQGGALLSDVDRETAAFGLAVTGGIVSHTGVGGLTLGGGIGHLMRAFGLTIDSLRSCDVVTADGRHVVASRQQNPELFWGLRGGGGNFGIVTSFEFELHALAPVVYAGMALYPMAQAPQILRALREFVADAPDEVGVVGNLRLAPPVPILPEEVHGQPVVGLVLTYAGDPAEGERVFAPLLDVGDAVARNVSPRRYVDHQKMLDAALPHGRHYYWKSWKLPPLSDEAIDVIVEQSGRITSGMSSVALFTQGGAVGRVADDETAYPHRDAAHDINIVGSWSPDDPRADEHTAWVRTFHDELAAFGVGTYSNFMSDEDRPAVAASFGSERFARLVRLKDEWDPDNVFRHNQNIAPSR